MMVPSSKPLKIVQTIPGPGTASGPGDILVDENGNRWRVMDGFEQSGTSTVAGATRTIRGGYLW